MTGQVFTEANLHEMLGGPQEPQLKMSHFIRSVFGAAEITAGDAAAGVTAAEFGDSISHVTALTLADFAVGDSGDGAALALGALLYTFPPGIILVEYAYLSVGVTIADATQSDTPEIGLGTAAASGATATLGAVGTTAEDILEGAAVAAVDGTVKTVYDIPTANVPLLISAAGAHTVYLNLADTWADMDDLALTANGTIILAWQRLTES